MILDFLNTEVNKFKFNLRKTAFLFIISVCGMLLLGISMVFVCIGFYYFLLGSGYAYWQSALLSSLLPASILLFIILIYWISMKLTGDPYNHTEEASSNSRSWLGEIAQFNGNPGSYGHHHHHESPAAHLDEGIQNFMDSVRLKPLDIGVSALVLGLVIGASPAVRRKLFRLLK